MLATAPATPSAFAALAAIAFPSAAYSSHKSNMCGRGRQNYAPAALFETARRDAGAGSTWKGQEKYKPTENLCPGKDAAVVVQAKNDGTPPQLQTKRWGLVAAFDKSLNPDFWRMFNARSETLHTSPVFRRLLRSRRCAVPFDGFWEWTDDEMKAAKAAKQPWYVHRKTKGEPLWLAGLYDRHDPFGPVGSVDCDGKVYEGAELETFTLVTMDVDKKLAWLHDRQPVILDAAGLAAWLAPPPAPKPAAKKLSGFMLFSKEMRPNIIAADPNLSFGDVSKCLGELWRGLPDAEKARYNRTCVPA